MKIKILLLIKRVITKDIIVFQVMIIQTSLIIMDKVIVGLKVYK